MIGAGKSGLIASKVLKQRGIPFDCFEAGSQVHLSIHRSPCYSSHPAKRGACSHLMQYLATIRFWTACLWRHLLLIMSISLCCGVACPGGRAVGAEQRQREVGRVRVAADQHLEADDQLSRLPHAPALPDLRQQGAGLQPTTSQPHHVRGSARLTSGSDQKTGYLTYRVPEQCIHDRVWQLACMAP